MINYSIFQIFFSYSKTFKVFEKFSLKGLYSTKSEDLASTLWRNVYWRRCTEQTRCPRNPGIQQLLGRTVVHIWKLLEAAVAAVGSLLVASENGISGNKRLWVSNHLILEFLLLWRQLWGTATGELCWEPLTGSAAEWSGRRPWCQVPAILSDLLCKSQLKRVNFSSVSHRRGRIKISRKFKCLEIVLTRSSNRKPDCNFISNTG